MSQAHCLAVAEIPSAPLLRLSHKTRWRYPLYRRPIPTPYPILGIHVRGEVKPAEASKEASEKKGPEAGDETDDITFNATQFREH